MQLRNMRYRDVLKLKLRSSQNTLWNFPHIVRLELIVPTCVTSYIFFFRKAKLVWFDSTSPTLSKMNGNPNTHVAYLSFVLCGMRPVVSLHNSLLCCCLGSNKTIDVWLFYHMLLFCNSVPWVAGGLEGHTSVMCFKIQNVLCRLRGCMLNLHEICKA